MRCYVVHIHILVCTTSIVIPPGLIATSDSLLTRERETERLMTHAQLVFECQSITSWSMNVTPFLLGPGQFH